MSNQQAQVRIKSSVLEGIFEDGLFVFRGVPYAEPPNHEKH
jgi:carboxylesterase type B